MSLALSTLIYEWRRYMAAVVALAFSGLLVLAFSGMFMGMGKSLTASIDRSSADILILSPGATRLFGGPSGVPRRLIPTIYQHPEVAAIDYMDLSGGSFETMDEIALRAPGSPPPRGQRRESVMVVSIVTQAGNPTIPTDYSPGTGRRPAPALHRRHRRNRRDQAGRQARGQGPVQRPDRHGGRHHPRLSQHDAGQYRHVPRYAAHARPGRHRPARRTR
jgi:hypothetical protein